jgi:malonate-semialdehyde dehydrogenase (acetylating)/methylmalonate-semialdehyde dehydrogenase
MTAVPKVQMLINGHFLDSNTSHYEDVLNPATQQVLAQVPYCTEDEVNAAVASAKKAFQSWSRTAITKRARIFLKFQELIRRHLPELSASVTAELGKIGPDAEGDVFRGLEVVEHACGISSLQMGEFVENVASDVNTFTMLQPLGVCAGITPFNFPGMIPLWMYPMAIACGNTFVLKPSELDPITTTRITELAQEAGLPDGVLNVVHGGKDVVNALCDHPDIKALSFVGSVPVGTAEDTDMGPLIRPAARDRVINYIEQGIAQGARLELDGRGLVVPGYEAGNFLDSYL